MMKENIGDQFQRETMYQRGKLPGGSLDWSTKPAVYKRYSSVPIITLPEPSPDKLAIPIGKALEERMSVRSFGNEPLSSFELSQLLWASQGITRHVQGFGLRTAPSAGALYPIETYLAVHNVSEVESGIYHYAVETHELEQLKKDDVRIPTARAALDQEIAYTANVVFIWTAIFERSKWKYRQRAYRYIYLDAGHIAQNVALSAVALGLGSCQVAALYDKEANSLLGIDGETESTVYMTVVGKGESRNPW
jgi:SagB-type dehydrogenase family enzyme